MVSSGAAPHTLQMTYNGILFPCDLYGSVDYPKEFRQGLSGKAADILSVSLPWAHPGLFPSCFLALPSGQRLFISQMKVCFLSVSQGRISLQSYQQAAATHVLPVLSAAFLLAHVLWTGNASGAGCR